MDFSTPFCFLSVLCFSSLCQERRTISFFPPPTHIYESVLPANAICRQNDCLFSPTGKNPVPAAPEQGSPVGKCDSVHAENLAHPPHQGSGYSRISHPKADTANGISHSGSHCMAPFDHYSMTFPNCLSARFFLKYIPPFRAFKNVEL